MIVPPPNPVSTLLHRLKSWLPWRFLISRFARRGGFLDPLTVLGRLRQFSQPSEVQEPIELIRAGVAFHARGLVNTKVLQNNLDWVWPYWVVRQFDPNDPSFLPRAFSFTHVNLTHRNWTAVGLPGMEEYPIIDPRGLVTPRFDGWSLDWWFIPDGDGEPLYPSQCETVSQRLDLETGLTVVTEARSPLASLHSTATVTAAADGTTAPVLRLEATVAAQCPGHLVLAVRPTNPEGISFVDTLDHRDGRITVNAGAPIALSPAPTHWLASTYREGDVAHRTPGRDDTAPGEVRCDAGLATGAALFAVAAHRPTRAVARMVLPKPPVGNAATLPRPLAWEPALADAPRLNVPDSHWRFLHDAAVRTLHLLSPGDVVPGPYTYRRFWFRDACLMLNALIAANQQKRARALLERFPARQKHNGYFHSQEGEWDANGQVLWIAERTERADDRLLDAPLWASLSAGADWITRKRVNAPDERHDGLLPPGFSAEHLGPNDYYYWDDIWGLAGLRAAARMARRRGEDARATGWESDADSLADAIRRSWETLPARVREAGVPASPYRRLDSGAIGSMVADYPLQLDELGPDRFVRTADWLAQNCFHRGGFFQDMIHSGVNAYLSLDLAQTFLRHGDPRYLEIIQAVADAASPTGQWPEAIHPLTGGGCMGDGQHGWAAAEWLLMMRALFVREETDGLVLGAGLPAAWLEDPSARHLSYGPTATAWGPLTVHFRRSDADAPWHCAIEADWPGQTPTLSVEVPGFAPTTLSQAQTEVALEETTRIGALR